MCASLHNSFQRRGGSLVEEKFIAGRVLPSWDRVY